MIIDFSLILKSIPYVLSGLPYIYLRNLSFELYHWKLFCYSSCRYADVTKALVKVSRPVSTFHLCVGVPMLVVLFIIYFGLPYVGIQIPALLCAIIGFSTVSAAYMAEIFRSSISAVDKGRRRLLISRTSSKANYSSHHFTSSPTYCSSTTCNVIIDMVKSSSLAAMITVPDIFQNAKIIGGREYDYMSMYNSNCLYLLGT